MKEIYKGFIIYNDRFYIKESEIDTSITYEFKKPYIVQNNVQSNRKSYLMNEYLGNKNVKEAIDVYLELKDLKIPKQPHSIVFDFWFNELKKDTNSFLSTFGMGNLDVRFADFEDHFNFWDEFRNKSNEMKNFITD